jgi:hypothetical protein
MRELRGAKCEREESELRETPPSSSRVKTPPAAAV